MSLEKLLKYTNSQEFYQNANFNCVKIRTQNDRYNNVVFDFINEYVDHLEKTTVEKWRITAHRCEKFHDMYREISMPYIQLKLFKNHPLLWEYKSNSLSCKLIGFPQNIDIFLGQIYQAYVKTSNNWIQATKDFYATEFAYKKNKKMSIKIPENLKEDIEQICNANNISLEFKEVENRQNHNSKKLKVLIFGNDYISPDGFNIGQPYIIAQDFFAEKLYG